MLRLTKGKYFFREVETSIKSLFIIACIDILHHMNADARATFSKNIWRSCFEFPTVINFFENHLIISFRRCDWSKMFGILLNKHNQTPLEAPRMIGAAVLPRVRWVAKSTCFFANV